MYQEGDSGGGVELFGPGSDLVLSLLAVALLSGLLSLFLQGFSRAASLDDRDAGVEADAGPVLGLIPTTDSQSFFREGDAALTKAGEQRLRKIADEVRADLEAGRYHWLDVIGYASASPRLRGRTRATASPPTRRYTVDSNLDLSALRATSVAHYLHSLGIPYDCMRVLGWGRARSSYRAGWMQEHNAGLDAFDDAAPWLDPTARRAPEYYREQRVEIVGVQGDPPCSLVP